MSVYLIVLFVLLSGIILSLVLTISFTQSRRGSEDYALVVVNMCSVYHDKVYWWEGVLLLQRFMLNVVDTFGSELPLTRSLITIAVCLGFLLVHMSVRPMRHSAGAAAQTTFQVSEQERCGKGHSRCICTYTAYVTMHSTALLGLHLFCSADLPAVRRHSVQHFSCPRHDGRVGNARPVPCLRGRCFRSRGGHVVGGCHLPVPGHRAGATGGKLRLYGRAHD